MVRNACGLPNWRIIAKSSLLRSCQYWTVFGTPRMNARSRSSTSSRNFLPQLSSCSRMMEPLVSLVRNIMLLSATLYRITFAAMYKTCSGVAPRRSVRGISLLVHGEWRGTRTDDLARHAHVYRGEGERFRIRIHEERQWDAVLTRSEVQAMRLIDQLVSGSGIVQFTASLPIISHQESARSLLTLLIKEDRL
ncbi:hypothetical protein MRX96_002585 [Rhipicephalus microplus]